MNPPLHSEAGSRAAFWLVVTGFFALGLVFGSWQVMMADLQQAFALSSGQLGLVITVGVIGSLPGVLLAGQLTERWGARLTVVVMCTLTALAYSSFAWIESYPALLLVTVCLMASSGALDVGINVAAVNYEQNTATRPMSFFHAGYSGMGGFAALLTGLLLSGGLAFRQVYGLIAIILLLIAWLFWRARWADTVVSHAKTGEAQTHTQGRWQLLRTPAVLLLAAMTTLSFFSEGALELWSSVYLRLSLDLPTLIGAAGPAVFHFAMMLGRLSSGWLLQRVRRRLVLRLAGLLSCIGISISLATVYPPLILFGFLLCGLALSAVVPIVFSLAGDIAPQRAGAVISVITILGYGGFMLGPALIGGLAEWLGLRIALLSLIAAGIGITVMAFWLRHPGLDQR